MTLLYQLNELYGRIIETYAVSNLSYNEIAAIHGVCGESVEAIIKHLYLSPEGATKIITAPSRVNTPVPESIYNYLKQA